MKNNIKKLISFLLVSIFVFSFVMPVSAVAEGDIIVLYTNDVHCATENYAILAAYRAELISQGHTVYTVDAGDAIQGEIIGALTEGSAIVEIMNTVGYDVAIPGNHEFDYTVPRFLELAEAAEYQYICANLIHIPTASEVLPPYVIKEADGLKIAFVGIATPETYTKSTPTYFKDEYGNFIYSFSDRFTEYTFIETINNAVEGARNDGADVVVAVGHLGVSGVADGWKSTDVISEISGVDAFIDGHSHEVFDSEMRTDKDGEAVLHVSTGTKLEYFGEMRISSDGEITASLIDPDTIDVENMSDSAKDAYNTVKAIVDGYNEEFNYLYEVIGSSEVNLTDSDENGDRIVRNAETNLANFVTDAYVAVTGADIAMVNGGGVRASVPVGIVNRKTIMDINPWNNEMCVIEVSGKAIVDALEYGVNAVPEEFGSFTHVSGITFEVHSYIESPVVIDSLGDFVSISADSERRVRNVKVGGENIDPDKLYTVAGSKYMLQLSGFTMFSDARLVTDDLPTDTEVLLEYFTEYLDGVIPESIYGNPDGDGRIVIFNEEISEGDINSDGKIDITDYILIKNVYFEKYIPNKNERALSDVNDDGKINVFDMILVKQIYFAA